MRTTVAALSVTVSLLTGLARAQVPEKSADADAEEMGVITVTGSRTITDVLKSPTPIT